MDAADWIFANRRWIRVPTRRILQCRALVALGRTLGGQRRMLRCFRNRTRADPLGIGRLAALAVVLSSQARLALAYGFSNYGFFFLNRGGVQIHQIA